MLDRGITFLVRNKVIVFIVLVLILFFGFTVSPFQFGLSALPKKAISVDAIPNIGENQQIVFTNWPGQSPRDIEDQVTYPLTAQLLGIPGVKSVRSNSMFGFSNIYIIFEDTVDFYWSRSRILEKLNSIPLDLLPEGVQPKLGPDATALGQIFWYTLEGRNAEGKVTGGWDLHELRSIQDFYVKNALASTQGVSEVASVGGHVKEYQIDINPELMKQYGISLNQLIQALQETNRDIGARTLEINQVEYFVRGLGYVKSLEDIENTSIVSNDFTTIHVKDVAVVSMGPAERRGILDKGGVEVVGGVVTARFGANPMEVSEKLKAKILEISKGLPKKTLNDGSLSQLTIVPFYDRSELINKSLGTLGRTLIFELLITIIVVVVMLRSFKVSFLVSGLLPITILLVFMAMKAFGVEANIVSLAGIAIAIGTMVDMGIILSENIVRKLKDLPDLPMEKVVLSATKEVSGAILTAGLTTIISFIPVFSLTGPEGKLFGPLAFTKTMALMASMAVALFIIPPIAALVLGKKKKMMPGHRMVVAVIMILAGVVSLIFAKYFGLVLIAFSAVAFLQHYQKIEDDQAKKLNFLIAAIYIIILLSVYWMPLGLQRSIVANGIFILLILAAVIVPIHYFIKHYETILRWVLANKVTFLAIPISAILCGFLILRGLGREFMPTLDEGDFLLMPTSLPQTGTTKNNEVLKRLDMAVTAIPEVDYVVGKAGRTESALDPAPLSMYENLIAYKDEYIKDTQGNPVRFKVDDQGRFLTKSGKTAEAGTKVKPNELVADNNGSYYRNWREHIHNENDIWAEISRATQMPGVTSAPKLQPIETRLVMLQTGMRSALGIKVKGQDIADVEQFGLVLEQELKRVPGIVPESVFADRITGKPYLLLDIDRTKLSRYGLSIDDVQRTIEIGIGGKVLSKTVEGRERYAIRVRYPRELRGTPEDLESIYVDLPNGTSIPLGEFVQVRFQNGPQSIKSEDGFLVGYVVFDKEESISEVDAVERAQRAIQESIDQGKIEVPEGVSYRFSGTYENHLHAQKSLAFIIPVVLLVIFLVLYLQFRSVSLSLMVFSGIAVAFAGGFILLWCYQQPWFLNLSIGSMDIRQLFNIKTINLSVAVWVGFIALFGIATDDGVVMATYLNQSFKDKEFQNVEAIRNGVVEAGLKRVRPCLMTTVTTLLGLLPILMSSGTGANIMIPMAIPCFGGMLMALITLFIVPLLFSWQKEVLLNR